MNSSILCLTIVLFLSQGHGFRIKRQTVTKNDADAGAFGAGAGAGIGGLGRSTGIGNFENPFGAFAGLNLGRNSGDRIGAGCSGLTCGFKLGNFTFSTQQLLDAFGNVANTRNSNSRYSRGPDQRPQSDGDNNIEPLKESSGSPATAEGTGLDVRTAQVPTMRPQTFDPSSFWQQQQPADLFSNFQQRVQERFKNMRANAASFFGDGSLFAVPTIRTPQAGKLPSPSNDVLDKAPIDKNQKPDTK